ncbi:MAG: MogA/MoaB family molybdenum cofactor biosynthesis protein [Anaerolineales bacterium]|jgi:molybdenum cofactor synthesis domain-containing protein
MSLRFGIVIISDRSSAGEREDLSGPLLKEMVEARGWQVSEFKIIPDEQEEIKDLLVEWADSGDVDVILTSGGTGFAPRDVTPEATLEIIARRAPGLVEAIRAESLKITPHAMLSRAEAGMRGKTLIINFPGSPKAVRENFEIVVPVLPHAVELLREDPESESGHQL